MGRSHPKVLPLKQRKNTSFVLFLGVVFLSGLAVWHWSGSRKPASTQNREEIISTGEDQQLQKFSLSGFDETGKKFWNLEGDAAKIDPTQMVYLEENVTLRLKDTLIKTDLRTDSPVHVDHQNAQIDGRGAVGRPNDGFVQLNREISMTLTGNTVITCDGPMKIYYNDNKLIFYRNVKVVDQRGVLKAKRMDVYFDGAKKEVDRIIAIGDVVIERGTDTTHSRKAIYQTATGSIRLEGNPEINLHRSSSGFIDGTSRN
jgi:lipopolysaccharide export system protein LptC